MYMVSTRVQNLCLIEILEGIGIVEGFCDLLAISDMDL